MLLLPALASCDSISQFVTEDGNNAPTESTTEEEVKEDEKQEDKEVIVFKVSWYNEGKLITTTDVEENGIPVFNGTLPTKQSTSTVKYTFIGWNTDSEATTALKELPKVTKDLDLHAIFSSEQIVIKYRVTFYNCTKLKTIILDGTFEQYLNPILTEQNKSTKTYTNSLFSVVTNANLSVQCKKGFYLTDKGTKSVTITKSNYQTYLNQMK